MFPSATRWNGAFPSMSTAPYSAGAPASLAGSNGRVPRTTPRRQKLFELILPEANRGDFDELPDYLKEGLTVHFARRFADVAKVLF